MNGLDLPTKAASGSAISGRRPSVTSSCERPTAGSDEGRSSRDAASVNQNNLNPAPTNLGEVHEWLKPTDHSG